MMLGDRMSKVRIPAASITAAAFAVVLLGVEGVIVAESWRG
jgi:hypothetical protein